jgi:hypothetical protein
MVFGEILPDDSDQPDLGKITCGQGGVNGGTAQSGIDFAKRRPDIVQGHGTNDQDVHESQASFPAGYLPPAKIATIIA